VHIVWREALQRLDGARLVEVDHRVELAREIGVKVVALALGVGAVDHADRPLQVRSPELFRGSAAAAEEE
jgi:hypothetical protein